MLRDFAEWLSTPCGEVSSGGYSPFDFWTISSATFFGTSE